MVLLKILFLPDDHLTEQYPAQPSQARSGGVKISGRHYERYPTKISYQTLRKFGRLLVVAGWLVLTSFLMFTVLITIRQSGRQEELIDLMNIRSRLVRPAAEFSCLRSVITVLRSSRKACRHARQALTPHWSATSHLVPVLSSDWLDCWQSATPVKLLQVMLSEFDIFLVATSLGFTAQ